MNKFSGVIRDFEALTKTKRILAAVQGAETLLPRLIAQAQGSREKTLTQPTGSDEWYAALLDHVEDLLMLDTLVTWIHNVVEADYKKLAKALRKQDGDIMTRHALELVRELTNHIPMSKGGQA